MTALFPYWEATSSEFKFFVILEVLSKDTDTRFVFEDDLYGGSITLLGGIRGLEGEYLPQKIESFGQKAMTMSCDYTTYKYIVGYVNNIMNSFYSYNNPDGSWLKVYQLDILKESDVWSMCKDYLDKLGDQNVDFIIEELPYCPYTYPDEQFLEDPCCYEAAAWENTCNLTETAVAVDYVSGSIVSATYLDLVYSKRRLCI